MSDRKRNWEFIIYPESAKQNWREILNDYHFKGAISPLHNLDVWTESDKHFDSSKYAVGELKKEHYHVVLVFDGPKSRNEVLEINKMLQKDSNHPSPVDDVKSLSGSIQYLDHSNDKLKVQYSHNLIESIGGFDFERYWKLTDEAEDDLVFNILDFIDDYGIIGYKSLLDQLRDKMPFDDEYETFIRMFRYARKHTIFLNAILKDKRCSTSATQKL